MYGHSDRVRTAVSPIEELKQTHSCRRWIPATVRTAVSPIEELKQCAVLVPHARLARQNSG